MTRALELRQMSPVFTQARAIQKFDWSLTTGQQLLSRWSRQGWITALGPRAGVYANKPADQVTREDRLLALSAVTPSALLIGATAYSFAGATTQLPRVFEVAVMRGSASPKLEGVRYFPRPISWYRRVAPGIVQGLVPRLRPEWAWIDAHAYAGPWKADADDLDFSAAPDALQQLQLAAQALRIGLPKDLPHVADYQHGRQDLLK